MTKLKEPIARACRHVNLHAKRLDAAAEARTEDRFNTETRIGRAMQTGTIITAVTLGMTILIGILIYDAVHESLPTGGDPNDKANNTELQNADINATEDFAGAMELAPVVILVMVAALILAVVQRFQ